MFLPKHKARFIRLYASKCEHETFVFDLVQTDVNQFEFEVFTSTPDQRIYISQMKEYAREKYQTETAARTAILKYSRAFQWMEFQEVPLDWGSHLTMTKLEDRPAEILDDIPEEEPDDVAMDGIIRRLVESVDRFYVTNRTIKR